MLLELNNAEIWASQRRAIVELNSDLTIIETQLFDIIPFGAGEVVGTSGAYVGTSYPSSMIIEDEKLRAVWSYAIFDTASPTSEIIGNVYQYEQIDLISNETEVQPLQDATFLLDVLYNEEDFWVYGEIADTIIGNVAFNQRPVGHYSNGGEKLNTYFFDEAGSGAFSDGSIGTIRDGLFYSAYYGKSVDIEGCEEDNTVIDLRDADFNLLKRVKLPDCDLFARGKNSFAFTSTGDFYFYGLGGDNLGIYKFDSELNVLCSELISLPNEVPISLKITPDDGVIIETQNDFLAMKLYSFSCEADPILSDNSVEFDTKLKFFPNPTFDKLFIEVESNRNFRIEVISLQGKTILNQSGDNLEIQLRKFASGIYFIKIIDEQTGELISQEKIVKL